MRGTRPPACDLASATKSFCRVFMDLDTAIGDLYKKFSTKHDFRDNWLSMTEMLHLREHMIF
jgi:hypothetical protein